MATSKNIQVEPDLKETVRDYGWRHRISMSALVGQAIAEYAEGTFDVPPLVPAHQLVELKYIAPPEYDAALARARQEGVSLTDVIRSWLEKKTREASQVQVPQ